MSLLKFRLCCVVVLSFISVLSNGQNCSFDIDKKDAFTNQRRISSTLKIGPKVLNDRKHLDVFWTMTIEKNGGNYSLGLVVTVFGKRDGVFSQGQKMMAKLSDESIVEFTAESDILPSYASSPQGVLTQLHLKFLPDRKTLKKLAQSNITALKLSLGSMDLNAEIDEKHGNKISELAGCILAN